MTCDVKCKDMGLWIRQGDTRCINLPVVPLGSISEITLQEVGRGPACPCDSPKK